MQVDTQSLLLEPFVTQTSRPASAEVSSCQSSSSNCLLRPMSSNTVPTSNCYSVTVPAERHIDRDAENQQLHSPSSGLQTPDTMIAHQYASANHLFHNHCSEVFPILSSISHPTVTMPTMVSSDVTSCSSIPTNMESDTLHNTSTLSTFPEDVLIKTEPQISEGLVGTTISKTFQCQTCFKFYPSARSLKHHQVLHSEYRPHKCSVCLRAFFRPDKLRMHEATHLSEKPFECAVCLQRFTRSDKLKIHNRMHTGVRPYPCTYCPKRFTRSDKLKIHERIHTKDKPYSCCVCGKQFARSDKRRLHERTHDASLSKVPMVSAARKPKSSIQVASSDGGPVSSSNCSWSQSLGSTPGSFAPLATSLFTSTHTSAGLTVNSQAISQPNFTLPPSLQNQYHSLIDPCHQPGLFQAQSPNVYSQPAFYSALDRRQSAFHQLSPSGGSRIVPFFTPSGHLMNYVGISPGQCHGVATTSSAPSDTVMVPNVNSLAVMAAALRHPFQPVTMRTESSQLPQTVKSGSAFSSAFVPATSHTMPSFVHPLSHPQPTSYHLSSGYAASNSCMPNPAQSLSACPTSQLSYFDTGNAAMQPVPDVAGGLQDLLSRQATDYVSAGILTPSKV